MKSKEALNFIRCSGIDKNLIIPIEKDLEVLEILKPMLEVKKGSSWWYLDTKHCFFDSQEHIDLIREWLEK